MKHDICCGRGDRSTCNKGLLSCMSTNSCHDWCAIKVATGIGIAEFGLGFCCGGTCSRSFVCWIVKLITSPLMPCVNDALASMSDREFNEYISMHALGLAAGANASAVAALPKDIRNQLREELEATDVSLF
jgi:hypothetical protein